jgi:peptidoglycan-associated lipoprotein
MCSIKSALQTAAAVVALAGCVDPEVGAMVDQADLGAAVTSNMQAQSTAFGGDRVLLGLSDDFRRSAPDMITFAFNSAVLDPTAQRILDQQAAWIIRHPQVRLRIYGHTDLVGSPAYNYQLGQRRADVAAAYLVSRGVSATRLEAVASFGETRPLVRTNDPERLNRRTVTEVVGYAQPAVGFDFDGKRAHAVYQAYVTGEVRETSSTEESIQVFMPQ